MTKVVNVRLEKCDEYIGRRKGNCHFGNPFSDKIVSLAKIHVKNVNEAVQAYEDWLLGIDYWEIEQERRYWILKNLCTLKNKRLGCFCKTLKNPDAICHGDVLKELIEKFCK